MTSNSNTNSFPKRWIWLGSEVITFCSDYPHELVCINILCIGGMLVVAEGPIMPESCIGVTIKDKLTSMQKY